MCEAEDFGRAELLHAGAGRAYMMMRRGLRGRRYKARQREGAHARSHATQGREYKARQARQARARKEGGRGVVGYKKGTGGKMSQARTKWSSGSTSWR